MEMDIEIISKEAREIPHDHFDHLLHDKFLYDLKGDFKTLYWPPQNGEGRGTVYVRGTFDPLGVYAVVSKHYQASLIKIKKEEESEILNSEFFAPHPKDADVLESVLGGKNN